MPLAIGDAAYGGYVAGVIDTTRGGSIIAADASQVGAKYYLIVSPKSLENASLKYKTTNDAAPAAASTRWNGLTATAAMASATYPAADYCNGLTYPADGGSKWYLPALDELELIYRNLKATTDVNETSARAAGTFPGVAAAMGQNLASDPTGVGYTASVPGKTAITLFRDAGGQDLGDQGLPRFYWSATEYNGGTYAWHQYFSGTGAGGQFSGIKASGLFVRPVRRVLINAAPNAPTLTSPASNSTIDRTVTQRFAWTISDPDAGDSQSAFDLQYRLIGAGAWTTVSGTTPNQFYDFAPSTIAAGSYEWQARTYDALGVVGPYSASSFFTAASAPTAPTITAPVNNSTVNNTATLTWSAPAQSDYQVRRVADLAGAADTATVYYDSGDMVDVTTRTRLVDFPTNNRWEHVQVRVKASGLWSTWADVRVNVSFTPPAAPTLVLATNSTLANLTATITNPNPGGAIPATSYNDVYVSSPLDPEIRVATLAPANSAWVWWLPAAGRVYTVRVVAVAANGTTATSA